MGTWWMALAHLPTIDAQGCARRLEKERWWWGREFCESCRTRKAEWGKVRRAPSYGRALGLAMELIHLLFRIVSSKS